METSLDESKVKVNHNSKTEIYMNRLLVEDVNSFKYLGAALPKDGSSTADIYIRIMTTTALVTVGQTCSVPVK